jgi:hypothetical protein
MAGGTLRCWKCREWGSRSRVAQGIDNAAPSLPIRCKEGARPNTRIGKAVIWGNREKEECNDLRYVW